MTRVDRVLDLLDYLRAQETTTVGRIALALEVSPRTVCATSQYCASAAGRSLPTPGSEVESVSSASAAWRRCTCPSKTSSRCGCRPSSPRRSARSLGARPRDYVDRFGKKTKRLIEPHGLLVEAPAWYVLSRDASSGAARMFRMDRVRRPHVRSDRGFVPDFEGLKAQALEQRRIAAIKGG